MLSNLPSQYRKDPWILALALALGTVLDRQGEEMTSLTAQMSLDTVTWNLAVEERIAGITPAAGATVEERRAALRAKWRGGGKATLAQIKSVAESWASRDVQAAFLGGVISLDIINPEGPVDPIRAAVELIKPAHLPLTITERHYVSGNTYAACEMRQAEKFILRQTNYEYPRWTVEIRAGADTRRAEKFILRQI